MNTGISTDDYTQRPFLNFMISPKHRIWRHLSLFALIILLDSLNDKPKDENVAIGLLALGFIMALLYVNMYLLVPQFLFKQRYIYYVISTLILTLLLHLFFVWKDANWGPANGNEPLKFTAEGYFGVLFVVLILFACSGAIKLFQRTVMDYYRINQLEKSTLHAELERLKSQINPHFLFNTLNNVNVLTKKDPEKASDILHKLSDLLRYQLYDSAHNSIHLTGDIDFLNNLLELEKIRRDDFEFSIRREGEIRHIQLPPFLFIPFVENAVKHNADANAHSYVDISFRAETERLYFECRNSKPARPIVPSSRQKTGGLGLRNIRRRLQLLYPDTHTLRIQDQPNTYSVYLSIPIIT